MKCKVATHRLVEVEMTEDVRIIRMIIGQTAIIHALIEALEDRDIKIRGNISEKILDLINEANSVGKTDCSRPMEHLISLMDRKSSSK